MRRTTLNLLQCPRCAAGSLVPRDTVTDALFFGPARCIGCGATFPVNEGLIDLALDHRGTGVMQQVMQSAWLARSWDRSVRPGINALMTRGKLDRDSEYALLHTFVGAPKGAIVDLGCGPGFFLRRLSRDFPQLNVVGLDFSRPMLEEAMAQTREHGEAADFVRTQVPPLPFVDHSLGAIVASSLLHFIADLDLLLAEAARVLKPGGRLVASAWEAGSLTGPMHRALGLHPRNAEELRERALRAGFIRFERVRVAPFLTWKVELP